jgi:hypothetical protein
MAWTTAANFISALAAAVGPRQATGPIDTKPRGVILHPGDNIQAAVDSHAAGTKFYLTAGVYARQHVVAKDGDSFVGAKGAIMDGQNATRRAFDGSADNVVIRNLEIKNYTAGFQDAPIYAVNGSGWSILNNNIHDNAGVGLLFKDNILVRFNQINHNREMGFGSDGGVGIRVLDNEVAQNNYANQFSGDEDGGSKLWATSGAIISHNYVHDNHGPGLWDDFNNNNITYSYNKVENNYAMGIYHEIGYNASITSNWVTGNGIPNSLWAQGWMWNAGIEIAASGGVNGGKVSIGNNYVKSSASGNGIGLIQQDRTNSDASMGPWDVQNVDVHDNLIDLTVGGAVGGVQDLGSNAIFDSRNNHFEKNHYLLAQGANDAFWWRNNEGNVAFWHQQGQDLNGTFQTA